MLISEQEIDSHIMGLMNSARKAGADPILVQFLDSVYRPFMKLAIENATHAYASPDPKSLNPLLDAIVDLITLMVVNTSNYVASHKQLDLKVQFINMFFIHQASRMNDMLTEMYPGEAFARMRLDEAFADDRSKAN